MKATSKTNLHRWKASRATTARRRATRWQPTPPSDVSTIPLPGVLDTSLHVSCIMYHVSCKNIYLQVDSRRAGRQPSTQRSPAARSWAAWQPSPAGYLSTSRCAAPSLHSIFPSGPRLGTGYLSAVLRNRNRSNRNFLPQGNRNRNRNKLRFRNWIQNRSKIESQKLPKTQYKIVYVISQIFSFTFYKAFYVKKATVT